MRIERLVKQWAICQPTENFLFDITTNRYVTYLELYYETNALLHRLKKFGVKRGDVVSVQSSNRIEFIFLFFAIIIAGGVVNPIPHSFRSREVQSVLDNLNSQFFFLEKETNHLFPCFKYLISELFDRKKLSELPSYGEIELEVDSDVDVEQPAAIFLSSGSTGTTPKGILHTHGRLVAMAQIFSKRAGFDNQSVHLAFLPCGNTSFIGHSLLPMLVSGGQLVLAQSYLQIARRFWELIETHKVSFVQVVPAIAVSILNELPAVLNTSLKYISCGSAILPKEIQEAFFQKTGVLLINIYGTSEIGAVFFNDTALDGVDQYSIGRPFNGCEVRLVSANNKEGELIVKSPFMFVGYINSGRLDKTCFDEEGFFNTGDILRREQLEFYYCGRSDSLIVRGGVNISAEEIERVLFNNGISSLVVCETTDSLGDVITCYWENIGKTTEQDVRKIFRENLSVIKIPTNIVAVKRLERTSTGKIKRKTSGRNSNA